MQDDDPRSSLGHATDGGLSNALTAPGDDGHLLRQSQNYDPAPFKMPAGP
jgi:hypothetical protein